MSGEVEDRPDVIIAANHQEALLLEKTYPGAIVVSVKAVSVQGMRVGAVWATTNAMRHRNFGRVAGQMRRNAEKTGVPGLRRVV